MSSQYTLAANLVRQVKDGLSLKRIINESKLEVKKSHYALVVETLKHEKTLQQVAESSKLPLEDDKGVSYLKLVMLYELLFGRGKIVGGGAIKKEIMEAEDRLLQAKEKFIEKNSSAVNDDIVEASHLPIYVRINEIKGKIDEGRRYLTALCTEATTDEQVPALMKLPSSAKSVIYDSWVKEGKLIIQDKASCFPAYILFQEWLGAGGQGDFIDACAAPGNKTSHLAAQLHTYFQSHSNSKQCRIYAFDKSKERAGILRSRLHNAGADSLVQVNNQDFLKINIQLKQYSCVKCVLLDPSCSGSGIVRDITRVLENQERELEQTMGEESVQEEKRSAVKQRLLKLQSFQLLCLQKAASFPSVEFISYSTCSIHDEENEDVVAQFLHSPAGQQFDLTAPKGLESWPRRGKEGSLTAVEAKKVIRCAVEDGMNGFFVASFRRKQEYVKDVTQVEINQYMESEKHFRSEKRKLSADAEAGKPKKAKLDMKEKKEGGALFSKGGFHIGSKRRRKFGKK